MKLKIRRLFINRFLGPIAELMETEMTEERAIPVCKEVKLSFLPRMEGEWHMSGE